MHLIAPQLFISRQTQIPLVSNTSCTRGSARRRRSNVLLLPVSISVPGAPRFLYSSRKHRSRIMISVECLRAPPKAYNCALLVRVKINSEQDYPGIQNNFSKCRPNQRQMCFEVTFRQCSGSSGADGSARRNRAILRERLAEAGALALGQKWGSKQSIVLPQSGILRAWTTNLLGAGPTKANG